VAHVKASCKGFGFKSGTKISERIVIVVARRVSIWINSDHPCAIGECKSDVV